MVGLTDNNWLGVGDPPVIVDDPMDITRLLDDRNSPPMRTEPDASGWAPHGPCVAYREDGTLLLEMTYERGVANGPFRDYWPDGRLASEGQYNHGVQEGEWRFYHRPGEAPEVIQFMGGREIMDWDAFFGRTAGGP